MMAIPWSQKFAHFFDKGACYRGALTERLRIETLGTMNVRHIRNRLARFSPFYVVTSSGDKYPVPHPEFVLVAEHTVVVADSAGYVVNLDPLHIVGLEDIPQPKTGRARRRARP